MTSSKLRLRPCSCIDGLSNCSGGIAENEQRRTAAVFNFLRRISGDDIFSTERRPGRMQLGSEGLVVPASGESEGGGGGTSESGSGVAPVEELVVS